MKKINPGFFFARERPVVWLFHVLGCLGTNGFFYKEIEKIKN
jgi:hypothetical protein